MPFTHSRSFETFGFIDQSSVNITDHCNISNVYMIKKLRKLNSLAASSLRRWNNLDFAGVFGGLRNAFPLLGEKARVRETGAANLQTAWFQLPADCRDLNQQDRSANANA